MNTRGHLSTETFDLLSLSALADSESDKAQAHIETCESCRQRWKELEEDRQRFQQFVFPRTFANIEARSQPVPFWERVRRKWMLALPAVGLVVATVVLMVVVPGVEEPYIGIKGGTRLDVVALKGDRQVPVGNDTSLAPGDRIRFLVEPAGAPYVMVASRDGQGTFSLYYPFDGETSAPVPTGTQELPGSIELDAVSGRERIFAVFSDVPLRAGDVRTALESGADLGKLPGVRGVAMREFIKEGH